MRKLFREIFVFGEDGEESFDCWFIERSWLFSGIFCGGTMLVSYLLCIIIQHYSN